MAMPSDSADRIHLQELELSAHIGVPDEERARPQRLTVSLTLWPLAGFTELEDELEKTVDYAAVCRATKEFVAGRADKLIETLADALAAHLLENFPLRRVAIELRKFVLPEVTYVSVTVSRERNHLSSDGT